MAIFKGAGVAIVTPMKENGDVILISWGKSWKSRLRRVLMRSLSVEQRESLLPFHMKNTWRLSAIPLIK